MVCGLMEGVTHHLWSILGVWRWKRGVKKIWGGAVYSLRGGGGRESAERQPRELFLAEFAGARRQRR